MRVHDVFVLRRTGECLFHRIYGHAATDEDLITGFLSAITSFSETIGGKGIRSLVTFNKKFVFQSSEDVLYALSIDEKDDEADIEGFLEDIKGRFQKKYRRVLKKWDGKRYHFMAFDKVIDKLFDAYPHVLKAEVAAVELPPLIANARSVLGEFKEYILGKPQFLSYGKNVIDEAEFLLSWADMLYSTKQIEKAVQRTEKAMELIKGARQRIEGLAAYKLLGES